MKGRILLIVTGLVMLSMLWMKLELGLTRYFDADEFAYLHWAHNVYRGSVPYRDFLLYVPPGFLVFLAPLFFIAGNPLIPGRVLMWVVYIGICITLGMLLVTLRGKTVKGWRERFRMFLMPGIVLSFLPLPSDKFLEIRPDNLALLFSVYGLLCQVRKRPFWAGVSYGIALIVLPKALPQVVLAMLVLPSAFLLWGMGVPFAVFGLWVLGIGEGSHVWYSLTKLPFEVNRIGETFGMQPDLFFYPNATYYGRPGWNWGLVVNHIAWFMGLMTGVIRFVTPALGASRLEFLTAGILLSYVFAFMYGYPLRHAQYLIPIAAFVAFYVADGLRMLERRGRWGEVAAVSLIAVMAITSYQVTKPKLLLTNADDLNTQRIIKQVIPEGAYVFDLVGATIFYKDPYYVSAVPFGQWEQYLTRPLPSVITALEGTHTRYIYQGKLSRVSALSPKDQEYILRTYRPSRELGSDLLVRE